MSPPLAFYLVSVACSSKCSGEINHSAVTCYPSDLPENSQDKNWLRSDISPQSAQECQNTWTWSVPPTHLVSPAHNTHLQHTAKTSGSSSKKNVLFLQMLCTFTPTCFCPCYLPDMQCLFPLFYLLHSGHPSRLFNITSSDHVAEKKEQNGSWARSPALSPALPFPGGIWPISVLFGSEIWTEWLGSFLG